MAHRKELTVFYDGACPLCEREISFYRGQAGSDRLCWVDVSSALDGELAPGLSKDQALARFHVLYTDGTLASGGGAFAALWAALPGFRLLGNLFQIGPFSWVLDRAYDLFLQIRPTLQALVSKRDGPRA